MTHAEFKQIEDRIQPHRLEKPGSIEGDAFALLAECRRRVNVLYDILAAIGRYNQTGNGTDAKEAIHRIEAICLACIHDKQG